jgi:hypothetical protein
MEDKKTIAEMRHEVIDNTIRIEILLDDIIQTDLGLEPSYFSGIDTDGNELEYIENINQLDRFKKFFLEKTNLDRKFEIIKDIIKGDPKKIIPQTFWKDAQRIREIRNIFAHTLSPRHPEGQTTVKEVTEDLDSQIKTLKGWEKLYQEHTKLFDEGYKILFNLFYFPSQIV